MTAKQELLDKLRAAKEAKGLSYQDIVDITEKNGEAISIATVQRIFKKGSNIEDFRYHKTIRPIVHAVLGDDDDTAECNPEVCQTTIEALRAVADFKHEQILELQKDNEYLKSIVADYKSEIKWHRKLVLILSAIALLAFAAVVADLAIGSIGWFRY